MLKKRGLGHVEAVLTLVIFIGFLVFAFTFFSPFRASRTLTSTLDYSWREIEDSTSETLEKYSIVTDPLAPVLVSIAIAGTNLNATAINSSGKAIPSFTDNLGVHFQKPIDNFVELHYSTEFTQGAPMTGAILTPNLYTISSSDSKKIRFESLFLKLNNTYYSNYTGVKKQFNLPNRVQFGFEVIFSDGYRIEAYQNIPEGVEVVAKTDKIEIVRINGVSEYAEVRTRVW
ncbi:MAG: hypothetical protein ACP5NS_04550 [Candidatus Pacearchaeota archaeon]